MPTYEYRKEAERYEKVPDDFPDDFDLDDGAGQLLSDEEYIRWYRENKLEDGSGPAPDPAVDIQAEVGGIEFKPEFSDPDVNITNERETADHEIVSGHSAYRDNNAEYVVQALGRRPTEIEITGWITEEQLSVADNLVSQDRIDVVTSRWTGIAVPERVNVDYSRTYHEKHGWIFETDFDLLGAAEDRLLDDE